MKRVCGSFAVVLIFSIITPWVGLAQAVPNISEQLSVCAPQTNPSKKDSIETLSRTLSKAEQKFKKSKDSHARKNASETIAQSAGPRKALLIDAMKKDPKAALQAIILPPILENLKPIAGNCLEQYMTVTGTLTVIHTDSATTGQEDNSYTLTTYSGKRLALHIFSDGEVGLTSGMSLQVRGYRVDDEMLIDATDPQNIQKVHSMSLNPFKAAQAEANIPEAFGPQRVAVIMVNFQDGTQSIISKETVDDIVFNTVGHYYDENSYNQTSIQGQSFGRYTLPLPSTTCDIYTILNAAATAADADVDFTQYDRIVVTGPFNNCGFTGKGTIGKGVTLPNQDGASGFFSAAWNPDQFFNSGYVGHELGHNLGLNHARSQYCGLTTFGSPTVGCTTYEYGDSFDVMGENMTGTYHMNAPHKDMIGWFDIGNEIDIRTSGTYTLTPLEIATPGVKALKIPRQASYDISGNPTLGYLWLEYRQATGTDALLASTAFNGALAHISLPNSTYTTLVDAAPTNGNIAILPGTSLTDPLTGSTVHVSAMDTESLTVNVISGKTDFSLPVISITNPTVNTTVSGTVTIEAQATDPSGIEKVEFIDFTRNVVLGTDYEAPYTFDWDTTKNLNGTNFIRARAYDLSGQAFGVAGDTSLTPTLGVTVVNEDSNVPTISLVSPLDGSIFFGNTPITVMATATDNINIYRVRMYKAPNTFLSNILTSPYTYTASFGFGTTTVFAVAQDNAGNFSTSTPVTFVVKSDTVAPIVELTTPTSGSIVPPNTAVTLTASSTDNGKVTKVQFYVDNVLLKTVTTPPYTAVWNTGTLAASTTHTIVAQAFDGGNNSASSSPVIVAISDVVVPTVTITSPANNARVNGLVPITASASDNIGISKVEFYADGTLFQTITAQPYIATWNASSTTFGNHMFFAKAYDTSNNSATSSTITLDAADTIKPIAKITAPLDKAKVKGIIPLTVNATDNDQVAKVDIYVDNELYYTATSGPYTTTWNASQFPIGSSHIFAAWATDRYGNLGGDALSVTIADSIPPTVAITSPANNSLFTRSTVLTLTATSSDNIGVTKVEFLANGILKCTDTVAPYTCAWAVPSTRGVVTNLVARAYDAALNIATSTTVTVTSK
jgi:M6 family metalloprotease-like protein